jgi:hypothetical protein
MSDLEMSRRLGIANYEARWVFRSDLVRLSAHGVVPCANYRVQLEMRPERPIPPLWDFILYTQPICLRAFRRVSSEVEFSCPPGTPSVSVRDATGEHNIPILPAFEADDARWEPSASAIAALGGYVVYAKLSSQAGANGDCLVVPEGSVLPMIYSQVFGPASRSDCEAFVSKSCNALGARLASAGGEIPWPLLV